MIVKLMQGLLIGIAFVLPGLSAGTVILIFGFYRQFLDDIVALRLKIYWPMLAGAGAAALGGVHVIGYLLDNFYNPVMAFLFGMLLASVTAVVDIRHGMRLRPLPLLLAAAGFALVWFVICEPANTFTVLPPGGLFHFFVGGTLASATMLLPGVSGSAVLIIINLYDDAIYAVTYWQWLKLAAFSAGFAVGLLVLARLLSALYRRYQAEISFLLAGLILGSTRALLPARFNLSFVAAAICGALLVLFITRRLSLRVFR
ncbi:MAG TPA: DUF368 domain-containing protein [Firmicutes bacterium]|nr:DUF368 domain-containing protein [Bacillota bacterium]